MTRTRTGLALGTAVLGLFGLAGLTGCGPAETSAATSAATVEVASGAGPEVQALVAMGFDPADLALAPAAEPSGTPTADSSSRAGGRHPRLRGNLRRNLLHGESVVQTKDGTKTIAAQRGTVTAISDKSITVKSTDGFTQTWTLGEKLDVVQHRTTVQPSAVKEGAQLGIAGTKEGGTYIARFIVLP